MWAIPVLDSATAFRFPRIGLHATPANEHVTSHRRGRVPHTPTKRHPPAPAPHGHRFHPSGTARKYTTPPVVQSTRGPRPPAIASHRTRTPLRGIRRSDPRGGHGRELRAPGPARQIPRPRLPRLAPPRRGGGPRHRRVERRRQRRLRLPPLLHLQRQLRHRRHRFHQEHRASSVSVAIYFHFSPAPPPKRLWRPLG